MAVRTQCHVFEARHRGLVAVFVVFGALDAAVAHGVVGGDEVETTGVVAAHAHVGLAVDDPAGELTPEPRTVGDPDLDPRHLPEVGDARHAEHRLAVGGVGDGASDDRLDALVGEDRNPFHRPFEPEADAVVVLGEEWVLEFPGGTVGPMLEVITQTILGEKGQQLDGDPKASEASAFPQGPSFYRRGTPLPQG